MSFSETTEEHLDGHMVEILNGKRGRADLAVEREERLRAASVQACANQVRRLRRTALSPIPESAGEDFNGIYSIAGRFVPRWHFAMLNDRERNDCFASAIEHVICAGDHVLDIGAGTGLLGMMAVRAGAARVTSCEADPLLAEIARQVIDMNGMSHKITVIAKHSTDLRLGVDLERPADVVVSEIVDCGLVGEGLLPTIRHAREHLLTQTGRVLPRAGRLHGYLVSSESAAGLNRVELAAGFDVSLLNLIATPGHFPIRLHSWPHEVMSEATELLSWDMAGDSLDDQGCRLLHIPVAATGKIHALVAWFDLDLGGGITIRNSPGNFASHWLQALLPLGSAVQVSAGQYVSVHLTWRNGRLNAKLV